MVRDIQESLIFPRKALQFLARYALVAQAQDLSGMAVVLLVVIVIGSTDAHTGTGSSDENPANTLAVPASVEYNDKHEGQGKYGQ